MSIQSNDQNLAILISRTLRIGVFLAVMLGVAGACLYLNSAGSDTTHFHSFAGSNAPYTSLSGVLKNAFSMRNVGSVVRGAAIAEVGLFFLMLTPMLRVLFAFVAYVQTRDWVFVGITAIVLSILCASVLLH
jgi:uncharacterized membrane protein